MDEFNPVLLGKRCRARAVHHSVSGFSHYEPGQAYRIFEMLQRSDGAGAERVAIHNRRVHLIGSNARKDRAATSIEMGIVFQNAHGSFRGVETGAAFFKNLVTHS